MENPSVSVENSVDMKVVYVRFRGTYVEFRKQSGKMFKVLFDFAGKHNLITEGVTKVLTIYHDNPFITSSENLRTSVAMTIPDDTIIEKNDEVSTMTIKGKFAVGHFELALNEYEEAWQYMYQKWLFVQDVEPRDAIPFELYVTEPPKKFKEKSFTDIYIPIN